MEYRCSIYLSLSNDACDVINERQIEGTAIYVLFLSTSHFHRRASMAHVLYVYYFYGEGGRREIITIRKATYIALNIAKILPKHCFVQIAKQ